MRLGWISLIACSLLVSGCFDPDLGPNPFRCAKSGKKCPDDYTCQTINKIPVCIQNESTTTADAGNPETHILTDAELVPSKEGPVWLDGALVKSSKGCKDESSEPNNTAANATTLLTGSIPDWEICYAGDVDQYAISMTTGDKLVVTVKFYHSKGDLEAALLDPDGLILDSSRSETDDETVQISTATKTGTYVVGVWGFKDATGTYDLDIKK